MDGKFPARRFERDTKDEIRVIINRIFYDETINKHQEDILYSLKLAYVKKAHELISDAELTNPNEPRSDHPGQIFRVYEYIDRCYRVEMK